MAKDASLRAFKCPSCGAPLEPEIGTLTMKCNYCGGTVIIPESLRTPPPAAASRSGPTIGEAFDFALNGLDMNQIVGNAMQLPQAIRLAQQGRLDEAADVYSRITGMEHADAVESVKSLAAGQAVSLTPGRPGASWASPFGGQGFTVSPSARSFAPSAAVVTTSTSAAATASTPARGSSGRSCGLLIAIIFGVAVLLALFVAIGFLVLGGALASWLPHGSLLGI